MQTGAVPKFAGERLDSNAAYDRFRASSYFSSINGVRAICALIVVKEHVNWRLPLPRLFEWGFLGVDMFFVVSGFLIVTLLLRERDATADIDLRAFYVRRTLRIFPVYDLVVGLIALVAVATYAHSPKTWELYKWSIPVFLIYGQDLIPISLGLMFHTWSLAMEEQFYLVWPTVEKYLKATWTVPVVLLLLGVNQACNAGWLSGTLTALYGSATAADRPVFQITFTPILLGVLAAHLMHHPATGRRLTATLSGRWTPMLLLLMAIAVCQLTAELPGLPRFLLHLLFTGLLLSLVVAPGHVFTRLLDSRPLVGLGGISYGLYVYHVFVIAVIDRLAASQRWELSPATRFTVVGLISIGLASLSFRLMERPIMSWGRRRSAAQSGGPGRSSLEDGRARRPPVDHGSGANRRRGW